MTAPRLVDHVKGRAFMAPKVAAGSLSLVVFGVLIQLRSPKARAFYGERSGIDKPAWRFAGWRLFVVSTKRRTQKEPVRNGCK